MLPPACHDCGRPATHDWPGLGPTCLPCATAAMAHGHDHVHDEREDCRVGLEPFDATDILWLCCPNPRPPQET